MRIKGTFWIKTPPAPDHLFVFSALGFVRWREASAGGNEIASGSRLLGEKRDRELLSAHCWNYVTFYMLATITIKRRPYRGLPRVAEQQKKCSHISACSQIKNFEHTIHQCVHLWSAHSTLCTATFIYIIWCAAEKWIEAHRVAVRVLRLPKRCCVRAVD